jgi:hypothetical protein
MKKFTGTLASLAVITALASPAFAQDPQPRPDDPQAPQTQPVDRQQPQIDMPREQDMAQDTSVTGKLMKVDPDAMTITIQSADETEHTFRYADSTKVVGEEQQVSGLSTRTGQLVTVHFVQGAGDTRIATKVKFDKQS